MVYNTGVSYDRFKFIYEYLNKKSPTWLRVCSDIGKLRGFLAIWLKQLRKNVTFRKHYRMKSMFEIRHMILVSALNHYFSQNILTFPSTCPPV